MTTVREQKNPVRDHTTSVREHTATVREHTTSVREQKTGKSRINDDSLRVTVTTGKQFFLKLKKSTPGVKLFFKPVLPVLLQFELVEA